MAPSPRKTRRKTRRKKPPGKARPADGEDGADGEDSVLIRISKVRKFEDILRLGQVSASSLGLRAFQREVAKLARKILHCEGLNLYLHDRKEGLLAREAWSRGGEGRRRITYEVGPATFVGTCARDLAMLNPPDVQGDVRSRRMDPSMNAARCHSLLYAPMVLGGGLVGVVEAVNSTKKRFDEEDEFFMEAVCNQVSIVLSNFDLVDGIREQFLQTVQAMADAIGKKDSYTGGHTKRVQRFAAMIADEMNLPHSDLQDLRLAAVLHDVGKIGIEDKILKKDSPLTKEEFEVMKRHPRLGYEILGHIDGLAAVVDGMRFHHERPDGKGYPYGLKEGEIPLIASIISVADAFDAMLSNRPYSKGRPPMEAWREVLDNRGTQFDAKVVDAFDRAFRKTKMYRPERPGRAA